jgi:hypothetical protein
VTLSPAWTHVGWGQARFGPNGVWVVLFCQRLVEELRIEGNPSGLAVSGRLVGAVAGRPLLYAGLVPCQPAAWDAQTRRFRFVVPAPLDGYFRLGYVFPGNDWRLTNTFTWPRETEPPGESVRFAEPAAPP